MAKYVPSGILNHQRTESELLCLEREYYLNKWADSSRRFVGVWVCGCVGVLNHYSDLTRTVSKLGATNFSIFSGTLAFSLSHRSRKIGDKCHFIEAIGSIVYSVKKQLCHICFEVEVDLSRNSCDNTSTLILVNDVKCQMFIMPQWTMSYESTNLGFFPLAFGRTTNTLKDKIVFRISVTLHVYRFQQITIT